MAGSGISPTGGLGNLFLLSFIPEVSPLELDRLFMESVSHLALKLLSLMGERMGLFP